MWYRNLLFIRAVQRKIVFVLEQVSGLKFKQRLWWVIHQKELILVRGHMAQNN